MARSDLERLRDIFLKAEIEIINEIARLRSRGLIDYHAVAALERVQAILQAMEDESWKYIPKMIQKQFYVNHPERYTRSIKTVSEHVLGYKNAADLTGEQWALVDRLTSNLLFTIHQAADTTLESLNKILFPEDGIGVIGRLDDDIFRGVGLTQTAMASAKGNPLKVAPKFVEELRQNGVTAFIDKGGHRWSLSNYATMVCRTTSRQAEILSILTANPRQDLFKISSHGTTCKICAPFEGRVYSKSGTSKYYPPLTDAFGKVDPNGPDTLSNSWLNIHPNCLHVLTPWSEMGHKNEEVQRIRDFSDPKKNPYTRDPRSQAQIDAYRNKEKGRRKMLAAFHQFEDFRLEGIGPKTFETFLKHKLAGDDKYLAWVDEFNKE